MEIKNTNFKGAIVHPNAFVDSSAHQMQPSIQLVDGTELAAQV